MYDSNIFYDQFECVASPSSGEVHRLFEMRYSKGQSMGRGGVV